MDTITVMQAPITKTAAFDTTPDIDISGMKGDVTVHLRVTNLQGSARFHFSDSVDAFSNSLPGPSFNIVGDITKNQPIHLSFNVRQQWPSLRFGTTSAVLRLALAEILANAAGDKTITYQCWIESQS